MIYTRKSTAVGLDSDFNSLDAQREACAAYIERQQGWRLVDEQYDDGGFTGANTDRPAFQRLMADIAARKRRPRRAPPPQPTFLCPSGCG